MEIYPARELPMEGITSQWLMDKMTNEHRKIVSKEDLIAEIVANDATVIVTIGAGDLGEMVPSIKKALYESL
jgi:UDP-N-acetylmuramate--alanine ligase